MRYYDSVHATPFPSLWKEAPNPVRLEDAQRIVLDNVAEYYYRGTDQEEWDYGEDFINVAPPFANTWFEWRCPNSMRSKEFGTRTLPAMGGAVWMQAERSLDDAGWQVATQLWFDVPGRFDMSIPHASVFWRVGSDGTFKTWRGDDVSRFVMVTSPQIQEIIRRMRETFPVASYDFLRSEASATQEFLGNHLHIVSLALTFLHCKNVDLDNRTPDPALAKRTWERRHIKLHSFHTLHIEPMAAKMKSLNVGHGQGWRKRLHICRGHFKDYRERGLFGKTPGIFWWDAQLKGSSERGEISKHYCIHPSERERKFTAPTM